MKAPLNCEKGELMSKKAGYISWILVICMVLSLCGCSLFNKQSDAALSLCTSFCEDVKNGDADKLIAYFDGTGITADELREIITPSGLNVEKAFFSSCIKDSLKYNIQDPVYDYKSKTATVYLSWQQADYNCESALAATTLSGFKSAMISAPGTIITVRVTVDLSGESPRIANPKDVIDAVYAYNSVDYGIMPGLLSDYYSGGDLVLAPKGFYTNTKEIGFRINFKNELFNYRFVPGIIFTVARGDEVICVSDVITLNDNTIRLNYTSEMAGAEGLNEDGFLIEGDYTFMIFDEHSNDIATFKCEVKNEALEKENIEFEEYSNDYYLSDLVYEFTDSDMLSNAFVFKSGWWDYDGTSVGKSAFGSDTTIIGFSIAVSSDNDSVLYYEYYYSEEADFSDINESEPVYQRECSPSLYEDQTCYDFDYSSGEIKPGFYGLVVYSDSSKKHIVLTAACMVVEETSADLIG